MSVLMEDATEPVTSVDVQGGRASGAMIGSGSGASGRALARSVPAATAEPGSPMRDYPPISAMSFRTGAGPAG